MTVNTVKNHRRHGEGNIRIKPSGKVEASQHITLPDGIGRRVYGTGDSEKKARQALQLKIQAIRSGTEKKRSMLEFGSFAERVIHEREGLGDRTRDLYMTVLRLYLPNLQPLRLTAITPGTLRSSYAHLRERGLGHATRRHTHTVVRIVLEAARTDGVITANPADAPGVRPRAERGSNAKPPPAYTHAEAERFLAASADITHGEILAFLLLTGMRRGEVLGLRWSNVDLKTKTLKVRVTRSVSITQVYEGSPKTQQSLRTVPLSKGALRVLTETKALNDERHRALYPDADPSPYVFPGLLGAPMHPDNLRRVKQLILARADQLERDRLEQAGLNPAEALLLPKHSVHALRHTFVTLSAAAGTRLEVIARIIGDNPATVMKVYLHVFQQDVKAPELNLDSD